MGVNPVSHSGTVVVGTDGSRNRIETISLSLTAGNAVVGVLGIVRRVSSERIAPVPPRLSPRLQETLVLLAAGQSTEQVAASLGVAPETARNYIRRLLRALGAHSRLEAVVHGREAGLV
jgi:DNA-binding NarL/FixJ family response regulator